MKGGKAQRNARRAAHRDALRTARIPRGRCGNCGQQFYVGDSDGHYFPPSLGEPGFYVCDPRQDTLPDPKEES